jgi:hypothetical protein
MREAWDRVRGEAAAFADAAARRSYEELVPENVRVRALAREWLEGECSRVDGSG